MNTSTLIIHTVRYNLTVLHVKLYKFFYALFDKIEMRWWLLKNKGKSVNDYHLHKLGQEMVENGDDDIVIFFAARKYLTFMGWDVEKESTKSLLMFFHGGAWTKCYFDTFRLECGYRYLHMKTVGDLIDMIEFMKIVTHQQLINKIGQGNYKELREMDILTKSDEFSSILKSMANHS